MNARHFTTKREFNMRLVPPDQNSLEDIFNELQRWEYILKKENVDFSELDL